MRRRPRRTIGVLALALICAGLLAQSASAAPPPAEEDLAPPLGFVLKGTHGYLITAAAYVDPFTGREGIGITARRGNDSVSYSMPARVTPDSIHADLGGLGRVDLTFHPSGRQASIDSRCLPHPETYESGTFEGLVEFDGEGDFTRARATRLVGRPSYELVVRRFCGQQGSSEARGPDEPGARLAGVSYAHGRTLKFQVNKNRASGKALFSATLSERHGPMRIYRELTGVAPAGAFRFAKNLRTATLSPPAPFAGSATLTRSENSVSPRLTGDLTLAFPGRTVRMAEPGVHVSLVHARLRKSDNGSVAISFRR